jgi:hypothetical protein
MDLRDYKVGSCGLDPSGLGYIPVAGPNEPFGSIKGGKFLD